MGCGPGSVAIQLAKKYAQASSRPRWCCSGQPQRQPLTRARPCVPSLRRHSTPAGVEAGSSFPSCLRVAPAMPHHNCTHACLHFHSVLHSAGDRSGRQPGAAGPCIPGGRHAFSLSKGSPCPALRAHPGRLFGCGSWGSTRRRFCCCRCCRHLLHGPRTQRALQTRCPAGAPDARHLCSADEHLSMKRSASQCLPRRHPTCATCAQRPSIWASSCRLGRWTSSQWPRRYTGAHACFTSCHCADPQAARELGASVGDWCGGLEGS